jgi:hypothetical protein
MFIEHWRVERIVVLYSTQPVANRLVHLAKNPRSIATKFSQCPRWDEEPILLDQLLIDPSYFREALLFQSKGRKQAICVKREQAILV